MARPRQVSDEQILATTRACVIEHGANVSLDVVAEKLGVTGPALLKRFGNRRELLIKALMPPDAPPWVQRLEDGPDQRTLEEQLAEIFAGISDFFMHILPGLAALRQSGIPAEALTSRQHAPAKGQQALARWLGRARAQGLVHGEELDTAAIAMLGAVQGNIMMAHLYKRAWSGRSQREYLKDLVQLFTRALSPPARVSAHSRHKAAS